MPATKLTRKKGEPKRSRPSRGPTRFPGSSVFASEQNISHSHLYRVLLGERQSKRLLNAFAEWLDEKGEPWPTAAVRKPSIA